MRDLGAPFKLPACPGGPTRPAPLLGEHNEEVLRRRCSASSGRTSLDADRCALSPSKGANGPRHAPPHCPLDGIRVANFGWVWAGPVVGQTLGFLGAEVYKIESRARIDLTRMLPPFAGGMRDPDRSLSNHACWAGNGSVTST